MLHSCFPELVFIHISYFVMEGFKASGLSHVCKQWLGVSKDLVPVRHLSPRILFVVEYGYKLDQRLRWIGFAYLKEEGATPHPVGYRYGL